MIGLRDAGRASSGHFWRQLRQDDAFVIVDIAVKISCTSLGDEHQTIHDALEQTPVVANEYDRALKFVERFQEFIARIDIEVVCRLIQDQEVGPIEGGHRQH